MAVSLNLNLQEHRDGLPLFPVVDLSLWIGRSKITLDLHQTQSRTIEDFSFLVIMRLEKLVFGCATFSTIKSAQTLTW